MSFRREKYIPKGGPDGGDGGRGGSVYLRGDGSMRTLHSLTRHPHVRAKNGMPGRGKSMYGADADDRIVTVPVGTLLFDGVSGTLLGDITEDGQEVLVAAGGDGGKGNEHFKGATNQVPTETTPGGPAIECSLRLELKLIADVGLVGTPNAGKSTLLRAVSAARPRVASYPFTTLTPCLGTVEMPSGQGGAGAERRLIVADIPGLIEGAASGHGLGHDFLRHVERTSLIVHVIDCMPMDGSDPGSNYRLIREELASYSVELARKPELVLLNKVDLLPAEDRGQCLDELRAVLADTSIGPFMTSGVTGEGLPQFLETCWTTIRGDAENHGWSVAGG